MHLNPYLLFGIWLLLIETCLFMYVLYSKAEDWDLEIVDAVGNIVKPYNDERLKKCKELIGHINWDE